MPSISSNCRIWSFPSFKCLYCFSFIFNILLVANPSGIIILWFLIILNIKRSFLNHLIIIILKLDLIQWFVKWRFILNIFNFYWILIVLVCIFKIIIKLSIGLLRNRHINFLKTKISLNHWLLLHLSGFFKKWTLIWFSYALSSFNLSCIVLNIWRFKNGLGIEWIIQWVHTLEKWRLIFIHQFMSAQQIVSNQLSFYVLYILTLIVFIFYWCIFWWQFLKKFY